MHFTSIFIFVVCATAHTIFQRVSVNGVDQGQRVGVRVPQNDYPIQNVADPNMACNTGLASPVSSAVVTIPAGAKVGTWWQHILGGAQGINDADNPIAVSHKGPIQVYLAKVDNAATSGWSGLKWFKVASEGLDTSTGKWAVDKMIAGAGWWSFTMPSCLAPGDYLMRAELLALHSASTQGGAQFYMS
jgi:cellulase